MLWQDAEFPRNRNHSPTEVLWYNEGVGKGRDYPRKQTHLFAVRAPKEVHARLVSAALEDGRYIGDELTMLLDLREQWEELTAGLHSLGRPAPIPKIERRSCCLTPVSGPCICVTVRVDEPKPPWLVHSNQVEGRDYWYAPERKERERRYAAIKGFDVARAAKKVNIS